MLEIGGRACSHRLPAGKLAPSPSLLQVRLHNGSGRECVHDSDADAPKTRVHMKRATDHGETKACMGACCAPFEERGNM